MSLSIENTLTNYSYKIQQQRHYIWPSLIENVWFNSIKLRFLIP